MPAFLMPKTPPYGLGQRTRHGWRRGYRSVWAGDCRHVAGDSEREQFVNPNFGYASSRRVGRRERRVARGLKVQPVVRGQELRGKTSLSFGSRPPEVIRLSRHEKSRGQAEGMGARFVLPCDGRCDGRRAAGRQVRENSLTTTARPRVRWRFPELSEALKNYNGPPARALGSRFATPCSRIPETGMWSAG